MVQHLNPATKLTQVRQTSVTATGRWLPVCRCQHPYLTVTPGACERRGCDCPHHP